jgi:hypothetical protein
MIPCTTWRLQNRRQRQASWPNVRGMASESALDDGGGRFCPGFKDGPAVQTTLSPPESRHSQRTYTRKREKRNQQIPPPQEKKHYIISLTCTTSTWPPSTSSSAPSTFFTAFSQSLPQPSRPQPSSAPGCWPTISASWSRLKPARHTCHKASCAREAGYQERCGEALGAHPAWPASHRSSFPSFPRGCSAMYGCIRPIEWLSTQCKETSAHSI